MTSRFFRIYSTPLEEEITILVDPLALEEAVATRNLVYREEEIKILEKLEPTDELLQTLHRIKKAFHAWIVEVVESQPANPKES